MCHRMSDSDDVSPMSRMRVWLWETCQRCSEQVLLSMRTATDQPEGEKYCAAQANGVTGGSGENVYDDHTEVTNGLMPIKHAAEPGC
ncbi:unnamed protein product [Heligmosomoides polygyrus]|uniref:Uncharacterized protein n=1 Tax=Heligmosomoides polygyrus TaxID=6339 RepID=A0A183FFA0_HELPZ|nr:unnamed protein product [Heligmosomoides polygyrus]